MPMLSDFHFLNPEWLIALLPLGAILWGIGRRGAAAGAWQRVVDPSLLPHLLVRGGGRGRWLTLVLLAAGWLTAVIALANPTFERLPVPAYRGELARVVILDLSRSMETPDLEPSRLARARYKVADILERSRDGQVGLIAFAGDAFVVSPLTDDADTVLSMLDAVVPEIMPVQGSRSDLALVSAADLLSQAGATRGEVVLVGDDAGGPDTLAQAMALTSAGHRLSVIGVGTEEGAPIPGVRGVDGKPVLSQLNTASLRELADAGGGVYAPLSADGRDLDSVLRATAALSDEALTGEARETEVWRELGPWVVLFVVPLGALAFRRGWLLSLALLTGNGMLVPEPAAALSWDDLWQRRDQQAAAALERGDHKRALDLAEQPRQRGTASYRLGDFDAAAEAFSVVDRADGRYNLGNALARSGRLEEAVDAYEQALAQEPGLEDAAYNKALVEELLRQQQEQQQSQDGGEQGQQDDPPEEQEPSGRSQEDKSLEQQSRQGDQSQQGEQPAGREQNGAGADQQGEKSQERQSGEQEPESGEDQAAAQASDQAGESADTPAAQSAASGSDAESEEDLNPAEAEDSAQTEQAAADYREEAAQHQDTRPEGAPAQAPDDSGTEEREAQQAVNQWLRRIPDDPAGLLRRKFLYQYRSRAVQQGAVTPGNPW